MASPARKKRVLPELTWETITPKQAKEYLENANFKNRTLRAAHISRMARDIISGKWIGENGEAIRFDTEGRLVDGQHRLHACILANKSFFTLVVRGVPAESYHTVGVGLAKGVADFLTPFGEKNGYALAATTRLVSMWASGNLAKQKDGNLRPTTSEVLETLVHHPGVRESVAYAAVHKIRKLLTPSYVGLVHYVATQNHQHAKVSAFFDHLESGIGLFDKDATYHLRNFLFRQKTEKRKAGQLHVLALVIKAWKYVEADKECRWLGFRDDEEFPEL